MECSVGNVAMIRQDHIAQTTCLPCIENILQDPPASSGGAPAVVGHSPLLSQAFALLYECRTGSQDYGLKCAQRRHFCESSSEQC